MTSAQVGKTETFLNNPVGYFIAQDPSPILVIQPTLEMAQTWSKDRFAPMLRDSPALKDLVQDPRARSSNNTILHKTFAGGHITMAGANSASSLASRPIRIVFLDEVDRFPTSAGTEGDPVSLAKKRTTTFWNRKIIMTSTPTVKGASRIEQAFLESDQRKYYVPCPKCGEYQILMWSNIRWDQDENQKHLPDTAHYVCDHCEYKMKESDKSRLLLGGEWRATEESNGIAGFWINEIYSPWVSWSEMVSNFLEAKKYPETLKVFTNTALGESWEEQGHTIEGDPLLRRRELYPYDAPEGVLVITCAVDVQGDRLELEFRGWGVGEETWGVSYEVLAGDPSTKALWDTLDQHLERTFQHSSGQELKAVCVTVDSGHHTQQVYDYCKRKQPSRVYPVKGASTRGVPIVSRMSTDQRTGVRFYLVGTDTAKETVFSRLQIEDVGAGYCHFPIHYDEEYFKMLTAEHCVTRFHKGVARREWVLKKGQRRNEALDLFVYNFVALKILNPNFEVLEKNMAGVEVKPLKKVNKPYKIRREGSFVSGFK